MSESKSGVVIREDAVLVGVVRNCGRLEVFGRVEGEVVAEIVVVREGGRLLGTVRAGAAEVHGELKGNVHVKELIAIGATGSVVGDVEYGRLALAEGGNLGASVRNVPPQVFGDLELSVPRGGAAPITLADLNAVDPDDTAGSLTFAVSSPLNGHVARADAAASPLASFTQADLAAGRIIFVHDGSPALLASFNVVVSDAAGATSGAARTVTITVRGGN